MKSLYRKYLVAHINTKIKVYIFLLRVVGTSVQFLYFTYRKELLLCFIFLVLNLCFFVFIAYVDMIQVGLNN